MLQVATEAMMDAASYCKNKKVCGFRLIAGQWESFIIQFTVLFVLSILVVPNTQDFIDSRSF